MTNKSNEEKIRSIVKSYIDEKESDLYLYSGALDDEHSSEFISTIMDKGNRRKNVSVFLTTYGGNAHSAFRMTRCLQKFYSQIRLLVTGECKSAGTLVAIGSHEIAFGNWGELGPLDIQLTKPDEVLPISSGLDTIRAYDSIQRRALDFFETNMIQLVRQSGGSISTKMSCDVSCQLAMGLFQPIMAQIDPYRLAEVERLMHIAEEYGNRLKTDNVEQHALNWLIRGYSSHGFVIDKKEAVDKKFFKKIDDLTEDEFKLSKILGNSVKTPESKTIIVDFGLFSETKETEETEQQQKENVNGSSHRDNGDGREDSSKVEHITGAKKLNPSQNPSGSSAE